MKKLTLLLYFLGLISIQSNAQQPPVFEQGGSGTTNSVRFLNIEASTYKVLEGSPYIPSENFYEGSVMPVGTNTKWSGGYMLRLNTYSNQLEMNESGVIKAIYPNYIKGFKIGEAVYFSGYPAVDKLDKNSYFQLLYNGKVKLLKNTTTLMKEVRSHDDVKQGDKFDTSFYYYILENEKMTKVFPNKKALLKTIPSAKLSAVEGFINEKGFKFKAEGDFVEAIKFYDSL